MTKSLSDYFLYALARLISAFCCRLPLEAAVAAGSFFGRCFFFISSRRHHAYADLKSAFGPRFTEKERWKIVQDHYAHLGITAVEAMRFPLLDKQFIDKNISIQNAGPFFDIVEENRGAVLLTAHFGNWELLQIVSGILGKPIHVLARDQKHNRLNDDLNRIRQSHGSIAIRRGMGVRDLLRALRRKELVGVVGDQDAGKYEGVILPFFGRQTTVPTGAFDLARRTGAPILPCFIVRRNGFRHEVHVGEPIRLDETSDAPVSLEPYVRDYIGRVEDFVSRFPDQWLWAAKRWKHSWTKRLLILSDQKPGHVKQSEALAAKFRSLNTQYERPGMEYPTETLQVHFKSSWRRRLFPIFALFFIPWAQGRLGWLRIFFKEETQENIRTASADFIISAGSSLVPLNLCLARECRAKSVVLMKPGFPFNFFRYDLAVIPAHDKGIVPSETFRTLLAPSRMDSEDLEASARKLKSRLRNAERVKIALFLGGATRRYQMDAESVRKTLSILEKVSTQTGDYLLTTSRRTPDEVCSLLKQNHSKLSACQMLVIASEDKRPEVASGMMALADILIVTEDSISMISEAVNSGKKVIVLSLGSRGLPGKHRRFQEILRRRSAALAASPEDLEEKILNIDHYLDANHAIEEEKEALRKRLQAIL